MAGVEFTASAIGTWRTGRMRRINSGVVTAAVTLVSVSALAQEASRPALAGRWELNREASTAPGSGDVPRPDGPPGDGPPPGGRGGMGGGGRGGFGGGGFGGRGGGPGGGGAARPSADEMERRRALMEEVMQLPPRFTVAQKDDTISFIEPDGVAGPTATKTGHERHQLTNGVVETKTVWRGDRLENGGESGSADRTTAPSPFVARPRQLEVLRPAGEVLQRDGGRRGFDKGGHPLAAPLDDRSLGAPWIRRARGAPVA